MPRIVIAFLSFLFLIPQGLLATGQLTQVVMSKQAPDPNSCTAPPAASSFSTTDQAAWLWFYVSNVSVGDDYSVTFYTPAGTISGAPSDFGPETVPGSWCYAVSLGIAGNAPSNLPGAWNAYIFNKGSQIYRQPFTITGSTACTYSLSPASASVAAGGGSGSFTVTGSGCSASVASDAGWITFIISGSAVNYTVGANTGTTSRTGHITVTGSTGSATFTVTQAGASTTCTYSLPTSSANVAAAAGTASFTVTMGSGCTLSPPSAAVTWITPTASGGTVTYTVTANSGTSSRTGHITVNGQTFTVTQAGASGGTTATGNFTFNGFGSTSGLTLVGNAAIATSSDGTVLRVTPATGSQSGAAYSTTPVALGSNATFSTQFQFRLTSPGGWDPADGITFVLGTSTNGLGAGGVGIGYQGVGGKSVAIEFDTYNNGGDDGNSSNHVSIDTNGALTNTSLANVYNNGSCGFASGSPAQSPNTAAGCMSNGNLWTVSINYDGSKLTVTLTDPAKGSSFTAINGYAINLASILGQSTAYVGFTSGTGAGWENHDIVNWTFANTAQSSTAPWTLVTSSGDCPGSDVASSSGSSTPDPTKCTSAFNGFTAVCWSSTSSYAPNTCTYKNIAAASCTGGSHPGSLYRCDAGGSSSCTYSLVTSSASAAAGGGSGSFAVTTGTGCTLSAATADVTWITPTVSGTTVNYTVQANTSTSSRAGHITVNGQTFTVNQAAGSGVPPGCNYNVSPLSQSLVAAPATAGGNITGAILVYTSPTCAWSAASNNSWITILSGASGNTGNGAVNYKVDSNTSTTSRQGSMTVAYQTVTVTQAAGVACSYSINPTSNSILAGGGSSTITVTVTGGASCSWTASVSSDAAAWLHLGSTTSGAGNGTVNYSADPNTSTSSRTGTMTVAGLTFTVTQPGGASASGPNIASVVSAITYRPAVAQGSFFAIFGSKLGPTAAKQNDVFPIPVNLGGVTVNVSQGSITKKAYLVFVSDTQINAIMPSDAPLGTVQVTVNYNGSGTGTATVVKIAFGINNVGGGSGPGIIKNYNSDTDQPFAVASTPAKPGQVEIMVGSGLGPITTGDDQSPPAAVPTTSVQVWVGGKQASVIYSGRAPGIAGQDQINFTVPADAPVGCSIPVQVNAGGTWSNTVRMSISGNGNHCQDTFNPLAGMAATGGKSATLGLMRMNFNGQLSASGDTTTGSVDLGFGAFAKSKTGGDYASSPFANLPAPSTCISTNQSNFDLGTMMGGGLSGIDPTVAATLDAGAQLTVTGGAGGASGTLTQSGANPYMGLLGGVLNVQGATLPPPFLDGGPFTITGPGGADVGPFSTTIALAQAITWTNPPSTINRASPLTLTWSGGSSTQNVVIIGSSTDQTSKAYGGFTCVAPAGAHSFTIPANSLADLVSTAAASGSSSSPVGMLGLMPLEPGSMQLTPLPRGLDAGVVFDTTMTLRTVQVQ